MLSHVVLLKPRSEVAPAEREALVRTFEQAVAQIPVIRGMRAGRRFRHGAGYELSAPDLADYLIMLDFDDLAGLQAYFRHPAHQELARLLQELPGSAAVYDFEVGGAERLTDSD
jgi:hypothetical protein